MEIEYLLPESIVIVQGTIERIEDSKANTKTEGERKADVLLGMRGDQGSGAETLSLRGGGGDDDYTVELTPDGRLASVSYKSVGVGARVLTAGATLLATMAGIALRVATPGRAVQPFGTDTTEHTSKDDKETVEVEDTIRKEWEEAHRDEVAHKQAYAEVLTNARAQLLAARQRIVAADAPPEEVAAAVARVHRLEAVASAASREVDKIDQLYKLWRESHRLRHTEALTFTLSVDNLPAHDESAGAPDATKLQGIAKTIWENLGVIVEMGPAVGYLESRPQRTGSVQQAERERVRWRVPRPVRLWVWRGGKDGTPRLERSFEVVVVDKHSATGELELDSAVFGERGGALAFDANGMITKVARNDKSALGSIADAVGGLPAAVVSGLDSAGKASTAVGSLLDADKERDLADLKRIVEMRTKELELKGIEATAEEFADLKRLTQQVDIAAARSKLAPVAETELSRLQAELTMATARRDLEAVVRERALDVELAAAQAEIARLSSALKLAELRGGDGA